MSALLSRPVVTADVGSRAALVFGQQPVSDEPVWPLVDHFDLELVDALAQRLADINAPWRTPDDAEIHTIEADRGGDPDAS